MSVENDSPSQGSLPQILLVGGSGFVGSAVGRRFAAEGWGVRLVTRTVRPNQMSFPCEQFAWDGQTLPRVAVEGVRAVINLAGQPIFDKAWTHAYRHLILESRRLAGVAVKNAIDSLDSKPEVVVQISGTDFYGMDPREVCNEDATSGRDFMAEVGRMHEEPVADLSSVTRLCIARMGLVLGWEGGGLPQLWDVYASGFGGALGRGDQWMNWVHIEDVVDFFYQAVTQRIYEGVYNLVAPANSTNREFHRALCRHTRSLSFLTAPKFYLKAMMGKRSHFLLQAPKIVTPRAIEHGFTYRYGDLEGALSQLISERERTRAHMISVSHWIPRDEAAWSQLGEVVLAEGPRLCSWWHHTQAVRPLARGVLIVDRFEYELACFPLGGLALRSVRRGLQHACQRRRLARAAHVEEMEG